MVNMEELIKEKQDNLKQIDLLHEDNKKLREIISIKEKKLDEAILKRHIAKSGEDAQVRDLERIRNPKGEKIEAIQTGIATTLSSGFIGTIAAGSVNSKFLVPVLVASVALGATVGAGKLVVYKRFLAKNTEEELLNSQLRCQNNNNLALKEMIGVADEIKDLLGIIDSNNEKIVSLTDRNKVISDEIFQMRREEQKKNSPQKVKK